MKMQQEHSSTIAVVLAAETRKKQLRVRFIYLLDFGFRV